MDINVFASQIVGAHKMLAMVAKNPLLEISDKEAESLASALKNVMQYHNINISPSVLAYIQLIGVCLAVYGPRLALFAAASKAEKEAKKNAAEFNVQHRPA